MLNIPVNFWGIAEQSIWQGKEKFNFTFADKALHDVLQYYPDAKVILEIPTGEQYGMVISKDNTALKDAINKALGAMKSDGTYQKIMDKYADYFG